MDRDDDAALSGMAAVLSALLQSLHTLEFVGRHLDPERIDDVLGAIGTPDVTLRQAVHAFQVDELSAAVEHTLAAFEGVRASEAEHDFRGIYRALRREAEALEALFPLVPILSPVDDFFLDPAARADATLRLCLSDRGPDTGIMHAANDRGMRGGFLIVPESYRLDVPHPLVVALHGGSGHGRTFLWNWVRTARSRGLIVVCPTAVGQTWALGGPDQDTPHLARVLAFVAGRWNIDPGRMLLTGMSDGGTFALLSGLQDASPFTHLAPFAAGFHPMLVRMSSRERLTGLPVYLVHGARDWMFPVELARQAAEMFRAVGARMAYREVPDLAHVYPRDENAALVDWLMGTPELAD